MRVFISSYAKGWKRAQEVQKALEKKGVRWMDA